MADLRRCAARCGVRGAPHLRTLITSRTPSKCLLVPRQHPVVIIGATAGHNTEATALPLRNAAADGSTAPTPSPIPEQPAPPPFLWERHWVPVAPLASLDPSRPTAVMLLGQPLVVWHHASRGWVVMRDECPHRLAPLSEGRLEAGGTRLACSYHGWEFSEEGKCTRVPQLASDPRAATTACGSKRSCVTSFPTLELDGLLLAWLDDSEEGRRAAESAEKPKLLDKGMTQISDWACQEMPIDYTFWLEQGWDPCHANFLHAGGGLFRQEDSVPMVGRVVGPVDLHAGFRWEHGAYQKKQLGMRAVREFRPPYNSTVVYPQPDGVTTQFSMWVVPVRPGVSRTYGKIGMRSTDDSSALNGASSLPASGAALQSEAAAAPAGKKAGRSKGASGNM